MTRFVYLRNAVPVGSDLMLDVQYLDSAGNSKDADTVPTVEILDASGAVVRADGATNVARFGLGYYRLKFTVPDGFTAGTWNDIWTAPLDGYTLVTAFDFFVNSQGSVKAVGTVVEPEVALGDDYVYTYSQAAVKNINYLLKLLKTKLRNTAFKPDGSVCNVFDDQDLIQFIIASLSEFNATPTMTGFTFEDPNVIGIFADIIAQGGMLMAWSGQAILESGREFTITDNGVVVQPPPVSATINAQYSANLSDYRAKLKEIKRNLRPGPLGLGAGSLLVGNPAVKRLRHRKENIII